MAKVGRPKTEFNKKLFVDLVGIGCKQAEICWVFRDDDGKPANVDTLSRWCKREFGMNYQEYSKQNGALALKIQLRKNQLELSKKSAAMAIWLGKQYLDQKDNVTVETGGQGMLADLIDGLRSQGKDEEPLEK
jgi:hypothetical protein